MNNLRNAVKAISVALVLIMLTLVIDFFSAMNDYRREIAVASDYKYSLETNDVLFEVYSQGVFSSSSKVLVATSGLDPGNPLVFAASRNSNVIKSFLVEQESGKINPQSEFELSHSSHLFEIIDGIKKSKYFIFDLIVIGEQVFVSVVSTHPGDKVCDEIKILSLDFNEKGHFLPNEREVWKYDGCVKWRDDAEPSGNLSLRLASDAKSIFMTVGLEPLLPYTNVYPNDALKDMPPSLDIALERYPIFGSIIQIELDRQNSSRFKVIAFGLRSPQGLVFDLLENGKQRLWISDHGPRGGDELNMFNFNRTLTDYGWPRVSLGTYYMMDEEGFPGTFPVKFGSHEDFVEPTFYWTPSIAPSQLVFVPKSFKLVSDQWDEERLLVATLKDQSLHKLTFNDKGEVWSDERIFIGERIRDMDVLNFALVLGTDSGKVVLMRPLKSTFHSGSFPPVEKYTEPQSIDFLRYIRTRLKRLGDETREIVGR